MLTYTYTYYSTKPELKHTKVECLTSNAQYYFFLKRKKRKKKKKDVTS